MNDGTAMVRVMHYFRLSFALVVLLGIRVVVAAQTTSTNVTSAATAYPVKTYHDRGIRDLDAIGSRKIGCGRRLRSWYSIERPIAMGSAYQQQGETTTTLVTE